MMTIREYKQAESLEEDVELQVLPFQLPKLAESAGFYVPGHFYRENSAGCYRNFAFPGWTRKNIGYYFRFSVSRRINSATLYHIYPEYNAAGKADFSELSAFARASGCHRHRQYRNVRRPYRIC